MFRIAAAPECKHLYALMWGNTSGRASPGRATDGVNKAPQAAKHSLTAEPFAMTAAIDCCCHGSGSGASPAAAAARLVS
eukprot:14755439-Alexandrium_andersonii.AAC.1